MFPGQVPAKFGRAEPYEHDTSFSKATNCDIIEQPGRGDYEQRLEQAGHRDDNLRAAFHGAEDSDVELAFALASSLLPLWLARAASGKGSASFDAALADLDAQHPEVGAVVGGAGGADRSCRLRRPSTRRRASGPGVSSPRR